MNLSPSQVASSIRSSLNQFPKALSDQQRNIAVAVAIGIHIGQALQLPTSKVDDIQIHHATVNDQYVTSVISWINEAFPVDFRLARELSFKFYKFRYDMAYDPDAFIRLMPYLSTAFSQILPEPVVDILKKQSEEVNYNDYIFMWSRLIDSARQGREGRDGEEVAIVS